MTGFRYEEPLDGMCDRCGVEGGRHSTWHWKEMEHAQRREECPPAPKLPPNEYDGPPF